MESFSLNEDVLRNILVQAKPFGHNEVNSNLNIGFGFLYYGVVRALRPKHVLVIGSGYGFSVVCLALGLRDNSLGKLSFVDPSYSLFTDGPSKTIGGRGTWNDPDEVRNHFAKFGVEEVVTHYKLRSDEFFSSYSNRNLPDINLAFIDGSHKFQDVQFDFINVLSKCSKNSYIFVHDTNIYIRELLRNSGVKRYLNLLRREEKAFEIIDFPFSSGVALIRVMEPKIWQQLHDVSSRH